MSNVAPMPFLKLSPETGVPVTLEDGEVEYLLLFDFLAGVKLSASRTRFLRKIAGLLAAFSGLKSLQGKSQSQTKEPHSGRATAETN